MRSLFVLVVVAATTAPGQMPDAPVKSVVDPGVITTRQTISPAGVQSVFSGKVQGIAFGANNSEIWVLNSGSVFHLDWRANRVMSRTVTHSNAGMQGIRFDAASQSAYISAVEKNQAQLGRIDGMGKYAVVARGLGRNLAGALSYSPKAHLALVPVTGENKVAVVDTATEALIYRIDTGMVPFGTAINEAGTVGYVSNWGGRRATANDATGRTGYGPDADRIVVDNRGVASTGTLTKIDITSGKSVREIAVGLHPTALAWDEPHARLFVVNGNRDSISVVDTSSDKVLHTFSIGPFRERVAGIAPTAIVLSPDGSMLYVACGGINAIAVVQAATGKVSGLIPTAWYPSALAISPDAKYLAVATLLGPGSGSSGGEHRRFALALRGSASVIELPAAPQLANYTASVAENNRLAVGTIAEVARAPRATAAVAIPLKNGDPALIDNVVFIIKENRTYDQVLGDIKKGNGDPSLVMFGRDVTPNQHKLADQFVLLDNFYASGGNSADGHQWVTQANETDYGMWAGYADRSYPFDGSDPIIYSSSGFLWDAALHQNKTVRIYGEFAGTEQRPDAMSRGALLESWKAGKDFTSHFNTVAPIAPLNKLLAANYPGYSTDIPDVIRAQIFLADLAKWVKAGQMPNLTIMSLPSNHTNGTSPGTSTPQAMVADNDVAVGQIVQALSNSPFWKKMAIFIVEDDAQNGVDHVDGHRTACFVVSPYVRRGTVDPTFYSHPSILKTIELILGLPTLTIFDRIANEMRAHFQNSPDFTPFIAETPKQSLFDMNPQKSALHGQTRADAVASARMRWDIPDAAPTEKLNRILWRQTRGYAIPYPKIQRSTFSPYAVDIEDDDRESKEAKARR